MCGWIMILLLVLFAAVSTAPDLLSGINFEKILSNGLAAFDWFGLASSVCFLPYMLEERKNLKENLEEKILGLTGLVGPVVSLTALVTFYFGRGEPFSTLFYIFSLLQFLNLPAMLVVTVTVGDFLDRLFH